MNSSGFISYLVSHCKEPGYLHSFFPITCILSSPLFTSDISSFSSRLRTEMLFILTTVFFIPTATLLAFCSFSSYWEISHTTTYKEKGEYYFILCINTHFSQIQFMVLVFLFLFFFWGKNKKFTLYTRTYKDFEAITSLIWCHKLNGYTYVNNKKKKKSLHNLTHSDF